MKPNRISGAIRLAPGMFHRLRNAAGMHVRVLNGLVWLTETDNPDDVFLASGEHYVVQSNGLVLLEVETATGGLHTAVVEFAPLLDNATDFEIADPPCRQPLPQREPR